MATQRKKVKRRQKLRFHRHALPRAVELTGTDPVCEPLQTHGADAQDSELGSSEPDHMPWDDPAKSDEERWAEYKRRYHLILLPPKSPTDPKEGEYERIPGSFEIPIKAYPGWRMGFVPKEHKCFDHVIPYSQVEKSIEEYQKLRAESGERS